MNMRQLIDLIEVECGNPSASEEVLEVSQGTPYASLMKPDMILDEELLPSDDMIVEMANLGVSRTGVPGFIFISTKMGSHGPRVKYFLKPGRNQPSFSVSIEETPRVVANSLPQQVVSKVGPQVCKWVQLNREQLTMFWNQGDTLDSDEVQSFIQGLHKVD